MGSIKSWGLLNILGFVIHVKFVVVFLGIGISARLEFIFIVVTVVFIVVMVGGALA